MARLILIRHAESVANRELRFTGGPDEPLSEAGRAQADATGRWLRERFAPAALYSSPFTRALETARAIGAHLGLEPRIVAELREQDFGALRGEPYARFAELLARDGGDRWRIRPPGGETLLEVRDRAGPALDVLARRHRGEEIVIVSHGGVLAALRAWVAGATDPGAAVEPNAGGYLLEGTPPRYRGPWPLAPGEGIESGAAPCCAEPRGADR